MGADHWRADAVAAAKRTAESQLDTLTTAREKNADKAKIVKFGAWAQVVAIVLLPAPPAASSGSSNPRQIACHASARLVHGSTAAMLTP